MNDAVSRRVSQPFVLLAVVSLLAFGMTSARAAEPEELRVAVAGSPNQFRDFVKWFEENYRVKCLVIAANKGKEIPDAKLMADADALLLNLYRTQPTEEQLKYFQDYFAAGKPVVGMRKASHAFQNWLEVDRVVFGVKYGSHFLKQNNPDIRNVIPKAVQDHPLVKGHKPSMPGGGLYKYTELEPDVTVLIEGGVPGNMMPQTFYRINKSRNDQRVFYMRYDPNDLKEKTEVREMVVRGLFWAMNKDEATYRK